MNCYEHTFITKQSISDNQAGKLLSKYENIIKENSGEVLKTEEWGLRVLSYRIKNNKKGFYYHIKFKGDGTTVKELEKVQNIDDGLIRYLTIKVKEHDLKKNYFEKTDT
tara:strand:+ start:83 stop:409 length:327 start_codon:yes stop_codon:yes gene_type:complete